MEGMRDDRTNVAETDLDNKISNELAAVNNLSALYHDQLRFSAAEQLYRETLDRCRRTLGDSHKFTLSCMSNLGAMLAERGGGNLMEAQQLLSAAATGLRQSLGEHHPLTLMVVNNLAGVLREQGNMFAVEPLLRLVLEGFTEQMGESHPSTLVCLNNLAEVRRAMGDYESAEDLFRAAWVGQRQQLGDGHLETLRTMYNLAMLLLEANETGRHHDRDNVAKQQEAHQLLRNAHELSKASLGDQHPHTRVLAAECQNRLGTP